MPKVRATLKPDRDGLGPHGAFKFDVSDGALIELAEYGLKMRLVNARFIDSLRRKRGGVGPSEFDAVCERLRRSKS